MNRLAVTFWVGGIAVLTAAGCGPTDVNEGPPAYGPRCQSYASCESCTPVIGCGWCSFPSGGGACVSGPGECASSEAFTWTWDPSGCVTPDASGTSDATPATDSGQALPTLDASSAEASIEADARPEGDVAAADVAPEAAAGEAGDAGECTANTGTLCGASQPFGFTCTSGADGSDIPAPPASFGCTVVSAPTPAGTLFYCCTRAD